MSNEQIITRKEARERLFKIVFERVITGEQNALSLELAKKETKAQSEYIEKSYLGICENFDKLQGIVEKNSVKFSATRLYKTDLAALLIAVYEILYVGDIPSKVSISEALELSKKYSTEKSTKFINGVLAGVCSSMEKQ